MSLLTFSCFAIDKRSAIKAQSRISENTLFLLILFCGWPGALFAQTLYSHKSVKLRFIRISSGLILINVFLLCLFLFTR